MLSQMDRRRALKLFGALGATSFATACSAVAGGDEKPGGDATSSRSVRIGLVVPGTGGLKQIGDEMQRGFQLYLKLNQGKFGGHQVELIVQDEGATAESGKAAVDSLLNRQVLALTGVANADVMLAVRDTVENAQVPLVGSNASPADLQGVIYIWRTSCVGSEPGEALGTYLSKQVTGKIAIIAPKSTAGRDAVDGFRRTFGTNDARLAPNVIWTEDNLSPGKSFFGSYLQQVRTIKPAIVFCAFAGSAAVQFIQQYRAAGLTAQVYAPGPLTEGMALQTLGDSARNIYTAMNYSPDLDNAANRTFAGEYRRTYGSTPSAYAMASYDAAAVLDKAVGLAGGTLTPQRVNLMLGQVGQVNSPRGLWQFNQSRTPQQKWYLRQVRLDGPVLNNVLLTDLETLG